MTAIASGAVQDTAYGWDATDNITAIDDGLDPARSQAFGYDALYRLTDASGIYGDKHYQYDALGNRTQRIADDAVTEYAYAADSNRLAAVDGVTFSYDAAGNTLGDGERVLAYDARNRMAEADGFRYGYNAQGLRVFKPRMGIAGDITGDGQVTETDLALLQQALKGEAPATLAMDCNRDGVVDNKDTSCLARKIGSFKNQGQQQGKGRGGPPSAEEHTEDPVQIGWILFHYDESGQLIGEYDELGNPIRQVVWLENLPVAVIAREGVYFIHADHLNTPKAATDEHGAIVWQADATPFGEVTEVVNDIELNLRFPGQYHDRETGLHQNWHREYAPQLGRYTQSDPIGLIGGLSVYGYSGNRPLRITDSTGLLSDALQKYLLCKLMPDARGCGIDYADEVVRDVQRAAPVVAQAIAEDFTDCTKRVVTCSVTAYIGSDIQQVTSTILQTHAKHRADQTLRAIASVSTSIGVKATARYAVPGLQFLQLSADTVDAIECIVIIH